MNLANNVRRTGGITPWVEDRGNVVGKVKGELEFRDGGGRKKHQVVLRRKPKTMFSGEGKINKNKAVEKSTSERHKCNEKNAGVEFGGVSYCMSQARRSRAEQGQAKSQVEPSLAKLSQAKPSQVEPLIDRSRIMGTEYMSGPASGKSPAMRGEPETSGLVGKSPEMRGEPETSGLVGNSWIMGTESKIGPMSQAKPCTAKRTSFVSPRAAKN